MAENCIRRVSMKAGWIGLLSGESQGKALERIVPQMNAEGYRVAFVVQDKFSLARKVLNLLIFIVTLGFVGFVENLLIIGERVEPARAPEPRKVLPANDPRVLAANAGS